MLGILWAGECCFNIPRVALQKQDMVYQFFFSLKLNVWPYKKKIDCLCIAGFGKIKPMDITICDIVHLKVPWSQGSSRRSMSDLLFVFFFTPQVHVLSSFEVVTMGAVYSHMYK